MKRFLAILATLTLSFTSVGHAATVSGFAGAYDISNWSVSAPVGGAVDTSNAPASVTLIEPDNGDGGVLTFTTTAVATGLVTFTYDFGGVDFCCGNAGTLLNGVQTVLPGTVGGALNGSTGSLAVTAGDIFGFYSFSSDGILGSTLLTVSNFETAAPVPLPASMALLLAAFGGLGLIRRRATGAAA